MIYNQIEDLIGKTPLLKVGGARYGLTDADIYIKLEYLNPFGSVKDRTALGLMRQAGDINEQRGLIESSSGNTAKALQIMAARHGGKLTSVTNRIKVPETEELLRYLGTEIIALPGKSECPDPNDEGNPFNLINEMLAELPNKYYHTSQYENQNNPDIHYQSTAPELYHDLPNFEAYIAGVGTGGSGGGVIKYAKENNYKTKFIGVVSEPSDFLPGIRNRNELYETGLFNAKDYDDLCEVSSAEALEFLRKLVLNEGVLAGPTTGANFAAAVRYGKATEGSGMAGQRRRLVILACDRLDGYMSYIAKRQPGLFGSKQNSDVYAEFKLDETKVEQLEKPTDQTTVDWIKEQNVQVIDTRGVRPYNNFWIEGSLNLPEEYLREILEHGTPFDAGRPVLLLCPTGERSLLLANILVERGLIAYSLAGGLAAWRRAGLPLVRGQSKRGN